MLKKYVPVGSTAWVDSNPNKLKLDWNEGDLLVPEIKNGIIGFIESPNSTYYPNIDNSHLNSEIAKYCGCDLSNVELTASSDYAHEIVLKWLLNKNRDSSIVVFTPTYDNFRSTAETYFSKVHKVDLGIEDYKSVLEHDFSQYDLVYLSNPNNPTTDFLDYEKLEDALNKYSNKLFLVDEAYIDFDLDKSVKQLISKHSNIVISRTFSKAFGLAAFRIGYLVGSAALIAELQQFNNVKYVNAFAKIAALQCLYSLQTIRENIDVVKANKILLEQVFKSDKKYTNVISGGGNFLLVECVSAQDVLSELSANSVYVRSLAHLKGMENWIRITVPSRGLQRLISSL